MKRKIYEAELNLPSEYLSKIKGEATTKYGSGPTRADMQKMMELTRKIIQLQRGKEKELTELGKEIILDSYSSIIQDTGLNIKIVTPDDKEKKEMTKKALGDDSKEKEDSEEDDYSSLDVSDDINKRKIINNIMQGEAQNIHDIIYMRKDDISKIVGNNKLIDYYLDFIELNRKFDMDDNFSLEDAMRKMPEMSNMMEIEWDEKDGNDEPSIKVRVLDLVMLIHETVKGVYELISQNEIDADPVRAKKVLDATDSLKDEKEDIKYGPFIARDIRNYINVIMDKYPEVNKIPNIREFIFGHMIKLNSKQFVNLINGILTNEKWPETYIKNIIKQIQSDFSDYYNQKAAATDFEKHSSEKVNNSDKEEDPLLSKTNNQLNDLLNKALDDEDWTTAKNIQTIIDNRENNKK